MFSSEKKKSFRKVEKNLIILKLLLHIQKKDILSYILIKALKFRATTDCSLARPSCIPVESSPALPSVDDYDKIQKHVFAINSSG